MRKLTLIILSILLYNCTDESTALIEETENYNTELLERKSNNKKFRNVEIPLDSPSFDYTLLKSDSKVNIVGYVGEVVTQYPLIIRINKESNKRRLVIKNNANEDMYVILDKDALNLPLNLIESINIGSGVSIFGPDRAVRVPKGEKLIIKTNKKRNRYRVSIKII